MKKVLMVLILVLVFAVSSWAAGPVGSYGRVTCNGTAAQLYAGTGGYFLTDHLTVFIQNQSASVNVYIGPDSSVTTANAGIVLSPGAGISVDNRGEPWYGITAGSSASVGYTILY